MKSDLTHQKTVLLQVLLWNLTLFVRLGVVRWMADSSDINLKAAETFSFNDFISNGGG